MNKTIVFLSIIGFLTACDTSNKWKSNQQAIANEPVDKTNLSDYAKEVIHHRDSMSAMFVSGANGVFPKEDIAPTARLKYYSPNEAYKVRASFKPIENGEVIEMQTSTNDPRAYKRYGSLSFTLQDSSLKLTLYQNVEHPEYFFCPFKDLTNTKSTYGSGRYLDFAKADLDNPILDFNYAYNPYCAYNSRYSCPIPPLENHLKISILAGEKKWH